MFPFHGWIIVRILRCAVIYNASLPENGSDDKHGGEIRREVVEGLGRKKNI
jgi:hypothetical protein